MKGLRDTLFNLSSNIGSIPLNVNENSAVITYERLNHRLSLFFNGVLLSSVVANPAFVDDVIDWSTSDNLYVNRFFTYSPFQPAHYHKISVYDKILTLEEIEEIYNASQPGYIPPPPPPPPLHQHHHQHHHHHHQLTLQFQICIGTMRLFMIIKMLFYLIISVLLI